MIRVFLFFGILGVGVIIAFSLVPGELRPYTGYPNGLEHVFAYAVVSFLLTLEYPKLGYFTRVIASLIVCAFAMEILQNFVPDETQIS